MELYLDSPIRLHCVVLSEVERQLYQAKIISTAQVFCFSLACEVVIWSHTQHRCWTCGLRYPFSYTWNKEVTKYEIVLTFYL